MNHIEAQRLMNHKRSSSMNLDLFEPGISQNILPFQGIVENYGKILTTEQSNQYFNYFLNYLEWEHDEVYLYGKHYITDRKVVWYGDEQYKYRYSGSFKQAKQWNAGLFRLKQHIECLVGHSFNSCLANLYENGQQGLGWHSDDEPSLGQNMVIASLSFGATRKMSFKHKTNQMKKDLELQHGQLIVMRGETQHYWKHCITKTSQVIQPRINLTFRYFYI